MPALGSLKKQFIKSEKVKTRESFGSSFLAQANKTVFGYLGQIFNLGQADLLTGLFATLRNYPS